MPILIKNRLNSRGECFTFFKIILNNTPNLLEGNVMEMLIIASIKR